MSSSQNTIDRAVAAAKSNVVQISPERLLAFLRHIFGVDVSIDNVQGGSDKSGSSSGIMIFDASLQSANSVDTKRLVLRYDPKSESRLFVDYDLEAQFDLIGALTGHDVAVPKVYGIDRNGEYLGASGFVMDCIEGEAIPTSLFTSGPLVETDEVGRSAIYRSLLKALASVHRVDLKAAGLANFTKDAPGSSPQEKLINWWWKTWDWVHPPIYQRLEAPRQWLLDNIPEESNPVLMHGDPNLGNYLLKDGSVTAILDWELASVGSPELDLAIQILSIEAHRNDKSIQFSIPTRSEWISMYSEVGGRPLRNMDYFFKHAAYEIVIVFASMSRYLPSTLRTEYDQIAEFYWGILEG